MTIAAILLKTTKDDKTEIVTIADKRIVDGGTDSTISIATEKLFFFNSNYLTAVFAGAGPSRVIQDTVSLFENIFPKVKDEPNFIDILEQELRDKFDENYPYQDLLNDNYTMRAVVGRTVYSISTRMATKLSNRGKRFLMSTGFHHTHVNNDDPIYELYSFGYPGEFFDGWATSQFCANSNLGGIELMSRAAAAAHFRYPEGSGCTWDYIVHNLNRDGELVDMSSGEFSLLDVPVICPKFKMSSR